MVLSKALIKVTKHKIIVLKDGQLAEQGTHQTLLNLGGEYSRMWQLQQTEPT